MNSRDYLIVSALVSVSIIPTVSKASVATAFMGRAWKTAEDRCFDTADYAAVFRTQNGSDGDGATDGCPSSGLAYYVISPPVTVTGNRPLTVTGLNDFLNNFPASTVNGVVVDGSGSVLRQTGPILLPTGLFSTEGKVSMGSLQINGGEALEFDCFLSPGSKVDSVTY